MGEKGQTGAAATGAGLNSGDKLSSSLETNTESGLTPNGSFQLSSNPLGTVASSFLEPPSGEKGQPRMGVFNAAGGRDSLADDSQEVQQKLQMLEDERQKADEAASNLEKKLDDTSQSIAGSLK